MVNTNRMIFGGEDLANVASHLLWLVLIHGALCGEIIPPIITVHPEADIPFLLDARVTLSCKASGYPTPSYHWTKNNVKLNTNAVEKYILNNGELVINKATEEEQGIYYCWASNTGGTDRSTQATLTLAFLNSFPHRAPEHQRVELGDSILLKCNPPPSYPEPIITWYQKDELDNLSPVDLQNGIMLDLEGNLHFLWFRSQQAGVYLCACFNHILRVQNYGHTIQLSQIGDKESSAPIPLSLEWSSKSPVTELVGNTLKIQCIIGGYPLATVGWERTDANLPVDRHEIINEGTTLVIKHLQLNDSANYECTAFNDYSLQPVSEEITVIVRDLPHFVTHPISVNSTAGMDAKFDCCVTGNPVPDITWYINWQDKVDNIPHINTKSNKLDGNTVKSVLSVTKIMANNTMVITCKATNQYGDISSSCYLSVSAILPVTGSTSTNKTPGDTVTSLVILLVLYITTLS